MFKRSSRPTAKPIARFPMEKTPSQLLGEMHRPVVKVQLWSETAQTWRTVQMLVDTGADYTIIPGYIATWLDIDLSQAREQPTLGVGGQHTLQFLDNQKIKIGSVEQSIPIGIIHSTKIPPLLGRHQCLEAFQVLFSKRSEVIFWA